jgi:hypothetical protein
VPSLCRHEPRASARVPPLSPPPLSPPPLSPPPLSPCAVAHGVCRRAWRVPCVCGSFCVVPPVRVPPLLCLPSCGGSFQPVNVSALIECLLYGYLLLHEALTMSWQGWRKFTSSFRIARALVTLAAVLDTLVFIGVRQDHFRLAPYCRVVLIALLESVGPAVLSVFEMVPSYLAVLFIYVSFYLIQAWVMAMLLDDVLGKVPPLTT